MGVWSRGGGGRMKATEPRRKTRAGERGMGEASHTSGDRVIILLFFWGGRFVCFFCAQFLYTGMPVIILLSRRKEGRKEGRYNIRRYGDGGGVVVKGRGKGRGVGGRWILSSYFFGGDGKTCALFEKRNLHRIKEKCTAEERGVVVGWDGMGWDGGGKGGGGGDSRVDRQTTYLQVATTGRSY